MQKLSILASLMTLVLAASAIPVGEEQGGIKLHKKSQSMPPTTVNGAPNPFYPCGATQESINACPYRCWDNSIPGLPTLIDSCFNATQASQMIAAGSAICAACVLPDSSQVPASASDESMCQPVAAYLNSTGPGSPAPSRCGTPQHPISACSWSCAEQQVPFSSCSATNKTGPATACEQCTMMCSSPVLVFAPPQQPSNFSLSTGSCSSRPAQIAVCPYRCVDDGDQNNAYCSFQNRTLNSEFTTCTAC